MSPIELKGLQIQYGNKVVARDLNLVLDKAEIISIIGPNGSGKSTLLKTMARLILPSAGVVALNGRDMNSFSTDALARMISFMPQSMQAPGDLTCATWFSWDGCLTRASFPVFVKKIVRLPTRPWPGRG